MRSRRIAAAFVVAALLGASLTACETVGSLADKVLIGSALRDLKAQLESLDGVTATYSEPELQGDFSYVGYVQIRITDEDSIDEALSETRDALDAEVFDRNSISTSVSIEATTGGQINLSPGVTENELTRALDAWHAAREIVDSPVYVGIDADPNSSQTTSIAIAGRVTESQLEQLAQLPSAAMAWSLPGLEAGAGLPDANGRTLFIALTSVLPPMDYEAQPIHGLQLSWTPGSTSFVDVVLGDSADGSVANSPSWPAVKRALQIAIDSGTISIFGIRTDASKQGAMVELGACVADTSGDDVEQLRAALDGVRLPPGSCVGSW